MTDPSGRFRDTIGKLCQGYFHTTDFKCIGSFESATNNEDKKVQFLLILHEIIQKQIGSLVYIPNYPGKKVWSLIYDLSRFFGLMTPSEQAISTNIGKNFAVTLQFEDVAVTKGNLCSFQFDGRTKMEFLFITSMEEKKKVKTSPFVILLAFQYFPFPTERQ